MSVIAEGLPEPGTIGLTSIAGEVGKLIHLGQFLAEEPIDRWFTKNDEPLYEHAFLLLPDGQILQAEPGGATIVPVTTYSEIYWCENIAKLATPSQLDGIITCAPLFKGTKYSFLDYFSLAAHRLHIPAPGLKRYIESTEHMICSQLVDWIYDVQGVHIFDDKRWEGYVMPMDLYLRDRQLGNMLAKR